MLDPSSPVPATDATTRSTDQVVLLGPDRTAVGTAPRATVHTTATPLHLAFSVHLFRADGRVLLTRRALTKRTWPGVWTNSCCGHPRPGESTGAAVARRVGEELNVAITDLRVVLADFDYRAVDASGLVEHEFCPVHVARLADDVDPDNLTPDPTEVCEWAWVAWDDLVATARATPSLLSPWAVSQVLALREGRP